MLRKCPNLSHFHCYDYCNKCGHCDTKFPKVCKCSARCECNPRPIISNRNAQKG